MKMLLALTLLLLPRGASASLSRTIDADALTSSNHAFTWSFPTQTGTVMLSNALVQEAPSGTCNGTATQFGLSATPVVASTLQVYQNGILLVQGAGKDYTLSGNQVVLASACALGTTLQAIYSKF